MADSEDNKGLFVVGAAAVALGLGYLVVSGGKKRAEREDFETQQALSEARSIEVGEVYESLVRLYPNSSDEELEEMARAPNGPLDQLDDKYRALGLRI